MHYSVHRPLGDDDDGALLLVQAYASPEAFRSHGEKIHVDIPRVAALLESAAKPPPLYESLWLGGHAAKESFAQ